MTSDWRIICLYNVPFVSLGCLQGVFRVSSGCLLVSLGFGNVYMVLKRVSDLKWFPGFSRLCRFKNIQSSSFMQQNSNFSNWLRSFFFLSETNCSEVIVPCNSSSGVAFFVDINPGPPQRYSVKPSRDLSPFHLPCKTWGFNFSMLQNCILCSFNQKSNIQNFQKKLHLLGILNQTCKN